MPISAAIDTVFNQMSIEGNRPRTIESYAYIINQLVEIAHIEYVEDIKLDKLYYYLDILQVTPATKLIRLNNEIPAHFGTGNHHIFITKNGLQINSSKSSNCAISKQLNKYAKKLGLENINTHAIRRAYAKNSREYL